MVLIRAAARDVVVSQLVDSRVRQTEKLHLVQASVPSVHHKGSHPACKTHLTYIRLYCYDYYIILLMTRLVFTSCWREVAGNTRAITSPPKWSTILRRKVCSLRFCVYHFIYDALTFHVLLGGVGSKSRVCQNGHNLSRQIISVASKVATRPWQNKRFCPLL